MPKPRHRDDEQEAKIQSIRRELATVEAAMDEIVLSKSKTSDSDEFDDLAAQWRELYDKLTRLTKG